MTSVAVISPEADDPRENAVVDALFAAGLQRYHVRKPGWSREQLEKWLTRWSRQVRRIMWLHSHHDLVAPLGLGGVHFRDTGNARGPSDLPSSRSCHDLESLRASLGHFDSIFFGPIFPSLSKRGYGPAPDFPWAALSALLATRTGAERSTSILALGGITAETGARALALGFDGVAVLGAVWQSADPVRAFEEIRAIERSGYAPRTTSTQQATAPGAANDISVVAASIKARGLHGSIAP